MDDNPYKSPVCPIVEEGKPRKPLARYGRAALFALGAWLATGLSLLCAFAIIVNLFGLKDTVFGAIPAWLDFCGCAVVAAPVGAAWGWWNWRDGELKRFFAVTILLGMTPHLMFIMYYWIEMNQIRLPAWR